MARKKAQAKKLGQTGADEIRHVLVIRHTSLLMPKDRNLRSAPRHYGAVHFYPGSAQQPSVMFWGAHKFDFEDDAYKWVGEDNNNRLLPDEMEVAIWTNRWFDKESVKQIPEESLSLWKNLEAGIRQLIQAPDTLLVLVNDMVDEQHTGIAEIAEGQDTAEENTEENPAKQKPFIKVPRGPSQRSYNELDCPHEWTLTMSEEECLALAYHHGGKVFANLFPSGIGMDDLLPPRVDDKHPLRITRFLAALAKQLNVPVTFTGIGTQDTWGENLIGTLTKQATLTKTREDTVEVSYMNEQLKRVNEPEAVGNTEDMMVEEALV